MSRSRLYTSEGYDDSYHIISIIGRGTFGVVLKATHFQSHEEVAIKRIPLKRNSRNEIALIREVFALRNAYHKNIVRLFDVILNTDTVSLVMEYVGSSLKLAIEDFNRPLNDEIPRYYMYQLFVGVDYLHSLNIMHRDLKPDNILITSTGLLKITDFGQCCIFVSDDPNRNYDCQVASRWYRAPELLFGSTTYDPKVDEWACGCIFTEFYNGSPLFAGKNDIEQIGKLISVLGSPCERNWKGWNIMPDYSKIIFEDKKPLDNWKAIVPLASDLCLSLLRKLIIYSAEERYSAEIAMKHEFFIVDIPKQAPYIPPNSINYKFSQQIDSMEFDYDGNFTEYYIK
ncbi:Cyclin-dependent kinase [Dirofilaria immitis]